MTRVISVTRTFFVKAPAGTTRGPGKGVTPACRPAGAAPLAGSYGVLAIPIDQEEVTYYL